MPVQQFFTSLIMGTYIMESVNKYKSPVSKIMNACLTPLLFSSLEFGYPRLFIQLLSDFMISTCRSATMKPWITENLRVLTLSGPGGGSKAWMTNLTADNHKPLTL